MARGGKKEGTAAAAAAAVDPITEERTRLKKLAFSRHVLSQNPAKLGPPAALAPSKTVMKHHGKDILRKSQRKNRYLFSFPGLLGPISGGKIGDLKDLGTKNPVLYLDFPQGQMKLFGTIVYPKNRYLTMQFSKGGKNVTCDDYFDNMIVFSDAWWIGTKDENPEELQLQFPNELNLEKQAEYDFKGGIGATCDSKVVSGKCAMQFLEPESPKVDLEDDSMESPTDVKKLVEVTPSRHSARTAGKKFNFAEGSSGDDIVANGDETSDEDEEKDIKVQKNYNSKTSLFTESSSQVVFDVDNNDAVKHDTALDQKKRTAKPQDLSKTTRSSLVQTTLSTLFKKVEDKGRKSNEPADRKFASQSSDPDDSYQDIDSSDGDWTG
ncbi:DNA-binding protein RHL1 [Henckelia pumila]|uniref:DNA-binding protein RHL1 n=1 Tax=Henckelia pumila TaxID=405737 RepID=UPI003C6E56FA